MNKPLWSMDEWKYLEREVVTDPKGRQWTVALMDVLGQEGDPDIPGKLLELHTLQAGISRSSTQPLELFSWNAATRYSPKQPSHTKV